MSEYFQGEERLDVFPPLGKPIRMGAPDALNVTDKDLLRASIADSPGKAAELFGLIQMNHLMLNAGYVEWVLQLHAADVVHGLESQILAAWEQRVESLAVDPAARDLLDGLKDLLAAHAGEAGAVDRFRQAAAANEPNLAHQALAAEIQLAQDLLADLAGNAAHAKGLLDKYYGAAVLLHDALAQYIAVVGEVVAAENGQAAAEALVQQSFSSLSFFEGMCGLALTLPPADLAAFLAEHLRSHFSGAGRGGAVRIIEDDTCIRLVFAPCGSGGALRRRLPADRQGLLPEASPMNWNRAGEVPVYCAHCAFNELAALEQQGYPAFVTEFNPDPEQPCGWTIYKDPADIPAAYIDRLKPQSST